MKLNDEYFVWAVVLAVVVFAFVYSLSSREHLSPSNTIPLNDNVEGIENVLPPYSAASSPGDAYIRKSSLVPCTCTTHSMGCERHAGGKESSIVPGDKDGAFCEGNSDQTTAQDQNGLKRPFSKAFEEQGEPTGFLTSFAAFG
jgi:hypothetical protein